MIRSVLRVAIWLAIGSAVIAGLYWAFLVTPESSGLMLAISALLVLAMVIVLAIVTNGAIALARGSNVFARLVIGPRAVLVCVIVAAAIALIDLAILRGDRWLADHSGEISAWFIAQFGWADVTRMFRAEGYLSVWLRWVILPAAGLAMVANVHREGTRGLISARWVRAAWHWRTVLIATAAFVLLVALPWRAAGWRPTGLPPTWIEPTLAALRLALIAAAMVIGAAVVVVAVAREVDRRGS